MPIISLTPCATAGRRLLLAVTSLLLVATQTAFGEDTIAVSGDPIIIEWVQPEYPKEAATAKLEGQVKVEFVVEADGSVGRERVQQSTDEIFNASALTAVRRWRFKPALLDNVPTACGMGATLIFQPGATRKRTAADWAPPPGQAPYPLPITPARVPAGKPDGLHPDYPAELDETRLPGRVQIEFTVDEEGRVQQPKVLWASHPAFVERALHTLLGTTFTPAHQGPLPKTARMSYPVAFESVGARPSHVLAANGLEILDGTAVQIPPQPLLWLQPVYPYERLLTGEEASIEAEFTIDEEGRTREILVAPTPAADFAAAVRSAIEAAAFKPAQGDQGPVPVRLKLTQRFSPASRPVEQRLAVLLRPGGAGLSGPAGLDRKLQPLWRGYPVYPQELKARGLTGEAQVEFVIDRAGRVRLPRVLHATEDAFGWAAMTAVSQWVFEPPTKTGEPADIRVRVPVGFKPTAQ